MRSPRSRIWALGLAIYKKGHPLGGAGLLDWRCGEFNKSALRTCPRGCAPSGRASDRWSNPYTRKATPWVAFLVYGPPQRIRTSDLRLRRATLYPAELGAGKLVFQSRTVLALAREAFGFLRRSPRGARARPPIADWWRSAARNAVRCTRLPHPAELGAVFALGDRYGSTRRGRGLYRRGGGG